MINEDQRDGIIADLVEVEGGYSDHDEDTGGRTIFGVSERWFPEAWLDGIPSLERCVQVYRKRFWEPMRLTELDSVLVAGELFEAAVNIGPVGAVRMAQEAYNQLRPSDPQWIMLVQDGDMGPKTIWALNAMCKQYEAALYNAQNVLQGHKYMYSGNRTFRRGWLANRIRTAGGQGND